MEIYKQRFIGIIPISLEKRISESYLRTTRTHFYLNGRSQYHTVYMSRDYDSKIPSLVIETFEKQRSNNKQFKHKKKQLIGGTLNEYGYGTSIKGRYGTRIVYKAR